MKNIICIFFIVLLFVTHGTLVKADADSSDADNPENPVTLTNPLGTKDNPNPTPQEFIGRIIKAILGIVGSLALVMFTP